jgi:hypothetical protein
VIAFKKDYLPLLPYRMKDNQMKLKNSLLFCAILFLCMKNVHAQERVISKGHPLALQEKGRWFMTE